MRQARFPDRAAAGLELARRLAGAPYHDPIVFALPRGGVPIAVPVAAALGAPLALLLVRKIGVPWQPELAAGAAVDGDPPDVVWNEDVLKAANLDEASALAAAATAFRELASRRSRYPPTLPASAAQGRDALIVDDGIATGASVRAAIAALRRHAPRRIIVATPVAPPETVADLEGEADAVITVMTPARFGSVGVFYADFRQLSDADVIAALQSG